MQWFSELPCIYLHRDYVDFRKAVNGLLMIVEQELALNRKRLVKYSLIETAKANHIEPYAYLKHLFDHIPNTPSFEDIDSLLPWQYKQDCT